MNRVNGPSDQQKRYIELTTNCGLSFDEAVHALGRRSGAAEGYSRLSRNEQSIHLASLMRRGLTEKEARRVVGLPSAPSLPASVGSEVQQLGFATGCFSCGVTQEGLVDINGKRLCVSCRKKLKKARKAAKIKSSKVSYYNALSHPEGRGLKGYRK